MSSEEGNSEEDDFAEELEDYLDDSSSSHSPQSPTQAFNAQDNKEINTEIGRDEEAVLQDDVHPVEEGAAVEEGFMVEAAEEGSMGDHLQRALDNEGQLNAEENPEEDDFALELEDQLNEPSSSDSAQSPTQTFNAQDNKGINTGIGRDNAEVLHNNVYSMGEGAAVEEGFMEEAAEEGSMEDQLRRAPENERRLNTELEDLRGLNLIVDLSEEGDPNIPLRWPPTEQDDKAVKISDEHLDEGTSGSNAWNRPGLQVQDMDVDVLNEIPQDAAERVAFDVVGDYERTATSTPYSHVPAAGSNSDVQTEQVGVTSNVSAPSSYGSCDDKFIFLTSAPHASFGDPLEYASDVVRLDIPLGATTLHQPMTLATSHPIEFALAPVAQGSFPEQVVTHDAAENDEGLTWWSTTPPATPNSCNRIPPVVALDFGGGKEGRATPDWVDPSPTPTVPQTTFNLCNPSPPVGAPDFGDGEEGTTTPDWFDDPSPTPTVLRTRPNSCYHSPPVVALDFGDGEEGMATPDWFDPSPASTAHKGMTRQEGVKQDTGRQTLMYPLPPQFQLLELELYNTYHHHHVHHVRFSAFEESSSSGLRSTCTDPSYHMHTSHHRVVLVEMRLYTLHPTSSVREYFEEHEVRIRATSREPATYSTAVVKQNSLELVHHIVHEHDIYINLAEYQDHFTVPSICTQTCTRTLTQCRCFGRVGDFLHTHFHEHVHSVLIRPVSFKGESHEVGKYKFLDVTRYNLLDGTSTKLSSSRETVDEQSESGDSYGFYG